MAAHSLLSRDRAEAGSIVSRFSPENEALAREIIARYPRPKSAIIPLCHLVQEEHGYLTDDGMAHVAELVGVTAAQVQGTASFYEMFKRHETGRYVLGICTNISCLVLGGAELLARAEERLGIRSGSTTADGRITLEDTECLAACTDAPMCQVNYRYFGGLSDSDFDEMLDDLASGAIDEVVPPHGT
ncbi:MAG: NAD(P)H-dependent oxidoreductase subunit E, partial [Microthrixaceae bacterium]|nr:NAD(P)H-dependent oxidoreductase subunit E [Microthrixaceae bacterium]